MSQQLYAVYPPKDLPSHERQDVWPRREHAGRTADEAWEMFCYPALKRSGYEADGWYVDTWPKEPPQ